MNVLPYGDRALLVELPDTAAVVAYADLLRADARVGELVADVVPGARTVLLVARPGVAMDRLLAVVPDAVAPGLARSGPSDQVRRIPTRYDGPDLADVARLTGLAESEVVSAHTGTPWRVAFGGFAPGFAYLVGGDPRLHVPRRATPRTRVPAGAVGLAGEFSGIYPRESPGGWQLIGSTEAVLWDLARDEPALLTAGTTVRFEAIDG
ncbi:5-oxoprolinase subunit B family protein [Nocardioides ultimimeridianus]